MELDGLSSKVIPLPWPWGLNFDLLTWKPNQYVSRTRYIHGLILVKLAPLVMRTLHSHNLQSHHLLWPLTLDFWPQNLINTSMNRLTPVTKTGCNSVHWFLRHGVHKVFGMHRRTDPLADGQTQKHNSPGTEAFWRQRHINYDQQN